MKRACRVSIFFVVSPVGGPAAGRRPDFCHHVVRSPSGKPGKIHFRKKSKKEKERIRKKEKTEGREKKKKEGRGNNFEHTICIHNLSNIDIFLEVHFAATRRWLGTSAGTY